MKRHRMLLPVVAVSLLTALTGCGKAKEQAQGEPEIGQLRLVTNMATFTLPLDAFQLTEDQNYKVQLARNLLAAQCMRKFGFDIEPPAGNPPAQIGINERRYGLADESRAQTYGYRVPEKSNRTKPPAPELSPEGDAILTGKGQTSYAGKQVPQGGCVGEAKRQMGEGGPQVNDIYYAQMLGSQAYDQSRQDSRVRQAAASWSACMKREGYNYADPMSPLEDPALSTDQTTEQEIATAVADVRCRNETKLIAIWATIETAYQNRMVEQHRQQLEQVKMAVEARIRNAARLAS